MNTHLFEDAVDGLNHRALSNERSAWRVARGASERVVQRPHIGRVNTHLLVDRTKVVVEDADPDDIKPEVQKLLLHIDHSVGSARALEPLERLLGALAKHLDAVLQVGLVKGRYDLPATDFPRL